MYPKEYGNLSWSRKLKLILALMAWMGVHSYHAQQVTQYMGRI